jgi:hypothetical protein
MNGAPMKKTYDYYFHNVSSLPPSLPFHPISPRRIFPPFPAAPLPLLYSVPSSFSVNSSRQNIYVTTSGNFNTKLLQFTIDLLGVDRVIFSIGIPPSKYKKTYFPLPCPSGNRLISLCLHAGTDFR